MARDSYHHPFLHICPLLLYSETYREIYYLSNGTLNIKTDHIVWEIYLFTHIVKASRHFSKWWANAKNVKVAPTLNCNFNMSKMNCNHKKRSPQKTRGLWYLDRTTSHGFLCNGILVLGMTEAKFNII